MVHVAWLDWHRLLSLYSTLIATPATTSRNMRMVQPPFPLGLGLREGLPSADSRLPTGPLGWVGCRLLYVIDIEPRLHRCCVTASFYCWAKRGAYGVLYGMQIWPPAISAAFH